jgi:hypothetical protein
MFKPVTKEEREMIKPGRGLNAEFDEFCEEFAEMIGTTADDVREKIALAVRELTRPPDPRRALGPAAIRAGPNPNLAFEDALTLAESQPTLQRVRRDGPKN